MNRLSPRWVLPSRRDIPTRVGLRRDCGLGRRTERRAPQTGPQRSPPPRPKVWSWLFPWAVSCRLWENCEQHLSMFPPVRCWLPPHGLRPGSASLHPTRVPAASPSQPHPSGLRQQALVAAVLDASRPKPSKRPHDPSQRERASVPESASGFRKGSRMASRGNALACSVHGRGGDGFGLRVRSLVSGSRSKMVSSALSESARPHRDVRLLWAAPIAYLDRL